MAKTGLAKIEELAARRLRMEAPDNIQTIMSRIDDWKQQKRVMFDPAAKAFKHHLARSDQVEVIDYPDVLDDLQYGMGLDPAVVGAKQGPFRIALRYWMSERRDESLHELICKLCGHTDASGKNHRIASIHSYDPIRKLIRAAIHVSVLDHEAFEDHVYMFAQWVWCHKRLLVMEQDHNQVAFFLCGKTQNAGKTSFMRRVCKTVHGDWYREASFPQLFEKFGWQPLTTHWLLGVDDADKGSSHQVGIFKRTISSEYLTGRGMHQMNSGYPRRIATIIGTSNESVRAIVADPTGARRLWELPFTDAAITSSDNWNTRLSYNDILAAFQCVDELDEAPPIYKRMPSIAQTQSTLRPRTFIERFVEEAVTRLEGDDADERSRMPLMRVKKHMRTWAEQAQIRDQIPDLEQIAEEFDTLQISCHRDKKNKSWSCKGIGLIDFQ